MYGFTEGFTKVTTGGGFTATGCEYITVIDFESAPATLVAAMVILFAPAIKFALKLNWLVDGLKLNMLVGIVPPFTETAICPTEVTFCTIALIGNTGTEEVNGFTPGFTKVINGGGVA